MKTNTEQRIRNAKTGAKQAVDAEAEKAEAVYLGTDLHKVSITVTRIIDHSNAEPAQRMNWEQFWRFAEKQLTVAKKVYVVYEAGAFGFWVCRKLKTMGLECYVMHPEKLDPGHKRVQTDKRDSWNLADKLQRYVLGNKKAMASVYVPSEAEEQKRIEARHRRSLSKSILSLKARGRGLLLSQGIFQTQSWWQESNWKVLKTKVSPELLAALEDQRALITETQKRLRAVEKKLQASAPKELPAGFGQLTFVLLLRELCNYYRFKNRRNVGSFTGLCGAVSSSGPYHRDLSINKAGNSYLRTLLVELAWRMIHWQPDYTGLKAWNVLRKNGRLGNARLRKVALVAVARQLAVDIWRWQTGRMTSKQLGWTMKPPLKELRVMSKAIAE